MASVPGKRGSSGGRGNQPPNKRSKMETRNSSNPTSDQDSLDSDQTGPVTSMMIGEPDHLKCPICQDYPRLEVFQCDEGHIVCNECYSNIIRCPVCRALYTYKNIRNRVAETDLDRMTFSCSFRNSGCSKANILRNLRTAHEIQCDFNPNKTGFKFCAMFDTSKACQFRIEPNSLIQDPQHTKEVIEHLTSVPQSLIYEKVESGERSSFLFRRLTSRSITSRLEPSKLFEVYDGTTRKTIGYYALILRLLRKNLSLAVVGLNSANLDQNGGGGNRHSGKVTVKFSVKAKMNPNKVEKDGDECVPNLSWTIKSMYLDEWKDFMMIPSKDRPPFSFSVPLSFLEEYYEQEDGYYELSVSLAC